ncbi:hypothetical protein [Salinarchaeum laminariae]|uniref:hypothetical protein n=1 Tax=Salinarchaeum laminariae TaxID=869888 RepID=UPI0020BD9C9B|nr:hypothetical protein [Salinarchaeum laminariae]
MTVVALLAEPPRPGHVLTDLVDADVCTAEAAAELYAAMIQDTAVAITRSGGELLVNYPPAEDYADDVDPEAALQEVVAEVRDDVEDVRFEVQVGSTESARVGNTITHLLQEEGVDTAALLRPEAPLAGRTAIDAAAMKLRSDPVVVGPAPGGRVYYAGFGEPIDFEGALAQPAVETITDRAADAGLGTNFEAMQPLLQTADDVEDLLPMLRARMRGGGLVPEATAEVVEEIGLGAV